MEPDEQEIIDLAKASTKEGRQIEFKEHFDPSSAVDWSNIIKDIVAIANSGGGMILFGIADDGQPSAFNRQIILDIDPATVSDKIYSYTGEHFSEFKILEVKIGHRAFGTFLISESQTPIVFTRNGADVTTQTKQKPVFLKGTVYFRHGAKSEPGNTSDIKHVIDKVVSRTRRSWFEGVRKISKIGASDEVIINKRNPALQGRPLTLAGLLKVYEQGTPVQLSHLEFEALRKEYPLEYKEVVEKCKRKKTVTQRELQVYIDSCKDDQDLSINWKLVGKSLHLPFSVPNKYMYGQRVVDNF
jgi:hypothetical protein